MDLNTIMQTGLTLMVGALCWFIQRSIKKFDDGIAKLDERITQVDRQHANAIRQVEQKYNDLRADLPIIFVTREDHIREMNAIDAKLDKQDAKLDKLLAAALSGGGEG